MKSLEEYVLEKSQDEFGRDILTKEDITLDVLQNAVYSGSFMNDRAVLYLDDNGSFIKIKKDGWQYQSSNEHVLSGIISSKELWEKVQKAENVKMYEK